MKGVDYVLKIGRLVLGQGSLCYSFHATAAATATSATVFPI